VPLANARADRRAVCESALRSAAVPTRRALAALAFAVGLAGPLEARADTPRAAAASATASDPYPLRVRTEIALPVTLAAGAAWGVSEALKPVLAPSSCRFCAVNGLDAGARALKWNDTRAADTTSNVFAFGLAPAYAIGAAALGAVGAGHPREAWSDFLVVAEATAIAMDVNQLVKFAVGRERPFVHAGPATRPHEPDDDLSFFSGHSTFTATLASASTTVALLHHRSSWPIVAVSGAALALGTGYLRIAADKHYLTDVVTGLVVGSAMGIALPILLHRPSEGSTTQASIAPTLSGQSFGVAGVF
jgi:membrane-associated phospholipid phosphatase